MSARHTSKATIETNPSCVFPLGLMLAVCLLQVSGCERSPEAEYDGASDAVARAERNVERRQANLEESEAAAARWARQMDRDRQALLDAKRDLAMAEGRLTESATDQVLFRSIQRQLLQDKTLRATAVAVRVEQGHVTLTGQVPEEELRARAQRSVAGTRGVKSVANRIEVSPQKEKR